MKMNKSELEPKCYSWCPECRRLTLHGWESKLDLHIVCLECGCKHK